MTHPLEASVRARRYWSDLIDDLDTVLDEYVQQGYHGVRLETGSVTLLEPGAVGEDPGLSVLLPDNEFDRVESRLRTGQFASAEVYAADVDDLVLLGICLIDEQDEEVVAFPAYYLRDAGATAAKAVKKHDALAIHFRTLGSDRLIIPATDPGRFFPFD